jgi:hypothetical protein
MADAIKFKLNMRGMDIIQTVYGLLLALGLREAFLGFYDVVLQQQSGLPIQDLLVAAAVFVNIILLSLRFFWVPRNLRRLFYVSQYCIRTKSQPINPLVQPRALKPWETPAHICCILMHGAFYFLVCKQFEYYVFVSTAYDSYSRSAFATYVFVHASFLVFNALWLIWVTRTEDAIRQSWLKPGEDPPFLKAGSESKFWYRNNLVFSLLAVAPVAVFSSCDSDLNACLSMAFPPMQRPFAVIPTSAFNIAIVFEYFAYIFSALVPRDVFLALWALVSFGANSIIDLINTAPRYIGLEEIEEEVVHTVQVQPPAK